MSSAEIRKHLHKLKNPKKALVLQGFFKTKSGQYGEGDIFLGISVPELRKIAKKFSSLKPKEFSNLIHSPIHEDRLTALVILTDQAKLALKKNDITGVSKLADLYLKEKNWINSWDLVDISAPHVLGPAFFSSGHIFSKENLMKLVHSSSMWDRRIAILTTFYFIRQGQFELTLGICKELLSDEQDLMHKACGWMLREVGKKDLPTLIRFLDLYATKMPRTMLRYSIEKLPEKTRLAYLARKLS